MILAQPELLRRAAAGDGKAFAELMQERQHAIYALALRMMGSREDALDMAQEALLRIFQNLGAFRAEASFSTWTYRIAANVCLDALRRRARRKESSLELLRGEGFEPSDSAPSPEGAALEHERAEEMHRALASLPPDQRAAIVLRDVQGLSYEEAAEALGVNLNTLKSRLFRGRRLLRGLLSGDPEPFAQKHGLSNKG
ncbi:MAG: sigma-70 family RNA polymerase sigma factor [Christensenellaceae bacterium]|jgi:RNA polymerase sigma-70 factor (ECF subfamily)|nr:sigma-70 family RNA polymerase sigma factor [Christensenellaceae bacterium]